jgi:hypothetical protein
MDPPPYRAEFHPIRQQARLAISGCQAAELPVHVELVAPVASWVLFLVAQEHPATLAQNSQTPHPV